jgi:hypothetical protein
VNIRLRNPKPSSAENVRKYKARSRSRPGPNKRDLNGTVSYQGGRSSGNRSIPSSSRHSIQSHIPQHKESEQQARQKLYDQANRQVVQPVLAAGAEEEGVYGNNERYDNFSQQMREGNISGGAGGGSACISRSGGKQRQVVREHSPCTPHFVRLQGGRARLHLFLTGSRGVLRFFLAFEGPFWGFCYEIISWGA